MVEKTGSPGERGEVAEVAGDPRTAEAHRAAIVKEYSEFVAVEPIDVDGVRAYNPGDPVPVSNVTRHGYLDRKVVARVTTKAAAAVLDELNS